MTPETRSLTRRRFAALSAGVPAALLATAAPTPPSRKWTLFIVQHSHIDVGYTERQEIIADFHYQFIRQAVDLALAPAQNDRPPELRFKFTCEGFWQVEQFLLRATPGERERLLRALHDGLIELTAAYFHMTELPDQALLGRSVSFAAEFARRENVPLTASMECDINGLSWGMADALAGAGVRYLSMNINPHHGGYPLGRPLVPFFWESPTGKRVLVWSGLAYHRANVLGLMGGLTPDDDPAVPGLNMPGSGGYVDLKDTSFAERKLLPVLAHLEQSGYALDFLPLMGSGTYTDNSPPADTYCEILAQWNRKFGAQVEVRTATLAEFFAHLEKRASSIPVYRGEWTDWWSDGLAATPRDTALCRNALRTRRLVDMLDPKHTAVKPERLTAIDKKLLLYAEHTFGYSRTSEASVVAEQIFTRKTQHAIDADELASDALWSVLRARGEGEFAATRPFEYRVENPLGVLVRAMVWLPTDFWERSRVEAGIRVVDPTGRVYPHQLQQAPRGLAIGAVVELGPWEARVLRAEAAQPGTPPATEASNGFENRFYRVRWQEGSGITSLAEAHTGEEFLDPRTGALGAPIYQVFPGGVRWQAGRTTGKRMRPPDRTTPGKCTGIHRTSAGVLCERWEFAYEVHGTTEYTVEAAFYRDLPHIDVTVRTVKTDVRDPEGLYVVFPFAVSERTWHFDKPGAAIRPGLDQLPGTCCDYYCLQHGAALAGQGSALVFVTLDAPLVHLGRLRLWDYSTTIDPRGALFSWLTNNKWETNFRVLVGGAYEFRYRIEIGGRNAHAALARCRELSYPPIVMRA